MKTATSIISVLVCLGAVSCEGKINWVQEDMTDVVFHIDNGATRAASGDSLALFVFREDGTLANCAEGCSDIMELSIPYGKLNCFAVINPHIKVEEIQTEENLLSCCSYLKDNSMQSMEMLGCSTICFAAESEKSVIIPVVRFTAMIRLEKITLDWKEQYPAQEEFTIKRIFMENVVPSCPYSSENQQPDPSLWLNKAGWDNSCPSVVYWEGTHNISNGDSWECDKSLLAYPNNTAVDVQGASLPYSARYTRIVVQTSCGCYPVSIPDICGNSLYVIKELIITGPGSDNPDKEVNRESLTFEIQTAEWGENLSFEEQA